jgi:hypothetical protein
MWCGFELRGEKISFALPSAAAAFNDLLETWEVSCWQAVLSSLVMTRDRMSNLKAGVPWLPGEFWPELEYHYISGRKTIPLLGIAAFHKPFERRSLHPLRVR